MLNRELFHRDPLDFTLPNDGVAKVGEPVSPADWDVLRFEFQSFVCEGEYARGLSRILHSFLSNLSRPTQPAVWVSGFYGSGKSHLVRVLQFLWRDQALPDGSTAWGLVSLGEEVVEQFKEFYREDGPGAGGSGGLLEPVRWRAAAGGYRAVAPAGHRPAIQAEGPLHGAGGALLQRRRDGDPSGGPAQALAEGAPAQAYVALGCAAPPAPRYAGHQHEQHGPAATAGGLT